MKRLNFLQTSITLLVFLTAFVSVSKAQYANHFQKIFDTGTDTDITAMTNTFDGGYAMVGTYMDDGRYKYPLMMKLHDDFSEEWTRTYDVLQLPYPGIILPKDVQQTHDEGYIISGKFIAPSVATGAFLMRTDSWGEVTWFRVYPGIRRLNSVVETMSGGKPDGFGAAGYTYYDAGERTGVILRTDADGYVEWTRYSMGMKHGLPGAADYNQIVRYGEGLLAAAGYANYDPVHHDADVLLTVIKYDGNPVLHRTYGMYFSDAGDLLWEQGTSLVELNDGSGDLAVVGNYAAGDIEATRDPYFENIFAFRVTPEGDVVWSRRYGPFERDSFANRVITDGGKYLYITGRTYTASLGYPTVSSAEVLLLKIDIAGNSMYHDLLGDSGDEEGVSVVRNDSGHLTIVGNTTSFHPVDRQIYLMERYENPLRNCRDLREKNRDQKIDLPAVKALMRGMEEKSATFVVRADKSKVRDRILCRKTFIGSLQEQEKELQYHFKLSDNNISEE